MDSSADNTLTSFLD
jgi:hypothetical protein